MKSNDATALLDSLPAHEGLSEVSSNKTSEAMAIVGPHTTRQNQPTGETTTGKTALPNSSQPMGEA